MSKKEAVHVNGDEKFVGSFILYADSSNVLFYDAAAKTDKVTKAELTDLFTKGLITVLKSGVYYKPVCLKTTGLIANDGTTTAVTFTAA